MRRKALLLVLLLIWIHSSLAQRSDLSGLKICIDPGHGGHNPANDRHLIPDPGTDFWESESNFQKALLLKLLLEAKGATVLLTRNTNDYPNDADEPSLAARVALANANNVNWFHSIHSNAAGFSPNTSVNYTLMLVREKRSLTDPAASTGNGLGVPETQEALDIANIIGPKINSKLRTQRTITYLDWTFYGGINGGFSLGVLRGLLMPGELSEGSFHDYYPETRRLMNNSYRKMEAYALRDAFMQYFGVPTDTLAIIAGILRERGTGRLVNGVTVRLLPEDRAYYGDKFNNGFYMFDSLRPGARTLRFETPGYVVDSIQVTVGSGGTSFADREVESLVTPVERDPHAMPSTFVLYQNYPNPFNPITHITYDVGKPGFVSLTVFDLLGRQVRTLIAEDHQQGRYVAMWDTRDDHGVTVASGIYLYRLQTPSGVLTKKMVLLK